MFGYACSETPQLMPMPIVLAHELVKRLAQCRKQGIIDWLRPDGKSQVTVEYEGDKPVRVDAVVIAAQHSSSVTNDEIAETIQDKVIKPVIPEELLGQDTKFHINPTGRFVTGGPQGDCGVTGRKIIVDTYGGVGSHGGGAFSGKDPSKVDRSASYMARYIAKNCVAAGLAERMEIQLAYAIGVAEPVSLLVDTFGTERLSEETIEELIRAHFPLTPQKIIDSLNLRQPIFEKPRPMVISEEKTKGSLGSSPTRPTFCVVKQGSRRWMPSMSSFSRTSIIQNNKPGLCIGFCSEASKTPS